MKNNQPLKPLAIVVDSGCVDKVDSSNSDIYHLPLILILNETNNLLTQEFIDSHDSDALYKEIESKQIASSTSQSPPMVISDLFVKLLTKYQNIIYLSLAKKVSGQFGVVTKTISKFSTEEQARISIVDTRVGAYVVYNLALKCLSWYQKDKILISEIISKKIPDYINSHHLWMTIGDFGRLKKSGRASTVLSRIVSTVFKLHCTINCTTFPKTTLAINRTWDKTFNHVAKLLKKNTDPNKKYCVQIEKSWLTDPKLIELAKTKLKLANVAEIKVSNLAIIGRIHVGIDAIAYSFVEIE